MNTIKEIQQLNEEELKRGISFKGSWHWQYRASSWVYVGGLDQRLSIGDVICVFSQLGEIEDAHLVADEESGASKGFAFLKYEDFRSAVLAVDNMNGASLLGRTLRVDHKLDYTPPKSKNEEEAGVAAAEAAGWTPGEAYRDAELANGFSLSTGVDVFGGGAQGAAAVPLSALVGSHGRLAAAGGTTDWRRPSAVAAEPAAAVATVSHGSAGSEQVPRSTALHLGSDEEAGGDRSNHRHRRHRRRRRTGDGDEDDDQSRRSREGDRHRRRPGDNDSESRRSREGETHRRRRRFHRRRDGDEEERDDDGEEDKRARDRSGRHRDEDRGRRGGGRVKFRGAMPEDVRTAGPVDAEDLMRKVDK